MGNRQWAVGSRRYAVPYSIGRDVLRTQYRICQYSQIFANTDQMFMNMVSFLQKAHTQNENMSFEEKKKEPVATC